jgi:hypothetical protein
MAKVWIPHGRVRDMIASSSIMIREHKPKDLYDSVTFKVHNKLFGMKGITFSKKHVAIHRELATHNEYFQTVIIFHELVHVAQQSDLGWLEFMGEYFWEWVSSGFSYQNMKKIGFEKEAIDITKQFSNSIGYRISAKEGKFADHYKE